MKTRTARARLLPLVAATALIALGVTQPGHGDDRDLLQFQTANPYLFILLDTSSSMNLRIGDNDVGLPGDGDNPLSRIYAAKEALFTVFEGVDDVNFGFATFNQDQVRIVGKHWLYHNSRDTTAIVSWPFGNWPMIESGATRDNLAAVEDPITLGDPIATGALNTCANPLPLGAVGSADRARVNRFALLGHPATAVTSTMWIRAGNPARTYQVDVSRATGVPGDAVVSAEYDVRRVQNCGANPPSTTTYDGTFHAGVGRMKEVLTLKMITPYLMVDGRPTTDTHNSNEDEAIPNIWPTYTDVVQNSSCTTSKPHSGGGWESNYDSLAADIGDAEVDAKNTNDDPFGGLRIKPIAETELNPVARAVDYGDVIPFHWDNPRKADFLRRLAPNYGLGVPDFGVGAYVETAKSAGGLHAAGASGRRPVIAAGQTQLTKAILDFRCWYMGRENGKCSEWLLSEGWEDVACQNDSEFGCRRPFLVIISDGVDTCKGNAPVSDVAGMNSASGVRTWALNVGHSRGCDNNANGDLHSITNAGKGECVNVATKQDLLNTLEDILDQIRSEARAFASAAVPSVQAVADQAVYLTNFVPFNHEPIWEGHVRGFAKPVELDLTGKPLDTTKQWDAGTILKTAGTDPDTGVAGQYNASDPVGPGENQRRVYYSEESSGLGTWHAGQRLLATPDDVPGTPRNPNTGAPGTDVPESYVTTIDQKEDEWMDLWKALGLIPPDTVYTDLNTPQKVQFAEDSRDILHFVLVKKSATFTDPVTNALTTTEFVLGDIFHSDPIVIGQPVNSTYLQQDLEGDPLGAADPSECLAQDNGAASFAGNRGYRCFFERQKRRRQVLMVGANDGMVHLFNIAQYRQADDPAVTSGGAEPDFYDHGTGNELLAYMPRAVMPTMRRLATSDGHEFTVDGPIAAADVFIDPDHNGTPVVAERRWRSVAIASLREGGAGLSALDVTQPDELEKVGEEFFPVYEASYLASCLEASWNAADCGAVPYGSALWEFEDTDRDSQQFASPVGVPRVMDEDGNGVGDLGDTWSKPVVGRIRVCPDPSKDCSVHVRDDAANGGVVDKYVAIFGGGLDSADKIDPERGNFLYVVDVETGKILLKRQAIHPDGSRGGALPAEPAAIDVNQDGYLDRIYFGTTHGFLYRMDLLDFHKPDPDGPDQVRFPTFASQTVNSLAADGSSVAVEVNRIADEYGDGEKVWPMRLIFDARARVTDGSGNTTIKPRPIYFRPAIIVAQAAGGLAVAFGTGDREDLWSNDGVDGRFYLFLDQTGAMDDGDLPMDDADFAEIGKEDPILEDTNFLLNPDDGMQRGWFLKLDSNERVITSAFSLVGITFFATYQPLAGVQDPNSGEIEELGCQTGSGKGPGGKFTEGFCGKSGKSNLFLVNATNGNPLMIVGGTQQRFKTIDNFVTTPFSEFTAGSQAGEDDPDAPPTADDMTGDEEAILELLKGLFPANCRFVNARIQISTVASDTSIQKLASVPICLASSGWKEF